jgi:tryptophan synthase alpha chain
VTELRAHLERRRAGGRRLLVPYVMAGSPSPEAFPDVLTAVAEVADAVEIGLPFSDPLMDGPVIAAAGERAVRARVGPLAALELAAAAREGAPRVAMTYYNPVHRMGERAFCGRAADAGVAGLIVPDLPLEESDGLRAAAAARGLAWIPLVAPTSTPERVRALAATATGFVYAVSTLGVTGVRDELSARAARVAAACRAATDLPVLVGVGVSTPDQARAAAAGADGVVIGSAVVKLVSERGAGAARSFLREVRSALDAAARITPASTP